MVKIKLELAIIIVNYRRYQDTTACLQSLLNSDIPDSTQFVVVDNTPTEWQKTDWLAKLPPGCVLKLIPVNYNSGFARAVNIGLQYIEHAKPEHVLLINPDTTVPDKFFAPLKKHFKTNPKLGIIAPTLRHRQHDRVVYGYEGSVSAITSLPHHHNQYTKIKTKKLRYGRFVSFACAILSTKLIQALPRLDHRYFMYIEDVDYCLSAEILGYRSAVDPTVIISHQTSSSFTRPTDKLRFSYFSQLRFIRRWSRILSQPLQIIYITIFYIYLYLLWTYHSLKH